MTIQFDTLSFAKRLTAAGEKVEVAEAHAMALKEFVMDTVATKADILAVRTALGADIADVRTEIAEVRAEIAEVHIDLSKVRTEMGDLRTELKFDIAASEERLSNEIGGKIDDLHKDMDTLGLKLTVRLGGMLVVAVGVLASLHRFG